VNACRPTEPKPWIRCGSPNSPNSGHEARASVPERRTTDLQNRLLIPCAAREPNHASPRETQQTLAATEEAMYTAYRAIGAMGEPAKVEMEIREGHVVPALIHASNSTDLLCLGATGSSDPSGAGFGSTAAALARSAHCSVAVIRGANSVLVGGGRSIVAHVDGPSADDSVLRSAFQEAQLRQAPLVLVSAWRSGFDDIQSDDMLSEHDRRARARLNSYVADWAPSYPEVEVHTVVAYGMFLNYLTVNAKTIQFVIVGAADAGEVEQIVGPAGARAVRDNDFSLLVVR
jgi:nucleotide-binding universal stress UspA family protein